MARSSKKTIRFTAHWKRLLPCILLGLILFPAVQVCLVRWINPPLTTVMLQRAWQYPDWPREHVWIDLENVPGELLWFIILSEDGRFFEHRGVDWKEFNQVVEDWRQEGTPPRGASTITMQTARSLFLWQGRSYLRKALELYYSFWMELFLSKERILELYVNVVETGAGVFGMEAGARYHFDRSLEKTSRSQQARLVAILPSPLEWSARTPDPYVRSREQRILRNARKWKRPDQIETNSR